MKSISRWAAQYKAIAVFLVILIKIILAFLACYLGILLAQDGTTIPGYFQWLIAISFFVVGWLYFSRKLNYTRRKILEASFILCSFVGMTGLVNSLCGNSATLTHVFATTKFKKEKKPTAAEILASLEHRDKSTLTKSEKRILRKEFKLQLKKFVGYTLTGNQQKAEDSWKIVLTIIAAVGLLFLLTALVCNLSCNGADAAAVIVGVLGLAGLIWATIAIIKAIKRRREKST